MNGGVCRALNGMSISVEKSKARGICQPLEFASPF